MSGRAPRQKGDRTERQIVKALTEAGIRAKRIPLSGSANGYPGDISADIPGLGNVVLEVKCHKTSPLYGWLENRDALAFKTDRKEPLIVLRLEDFLRSISAGSTDAGSVSSPSTTRITSVKSWHRNTRVGGQADTP